MAWDADASKSQAPFIVRPAAATVAAAATTAAVAAVAAYGPNNGKLLFGPSSCVLQCVSWVVVVVVGDGGERVVQSVYKHK